MKDWRCTPSHCFPAQTLEVHEAFLSVWKRVLFRKIRGMSKTVDLQSCSSVAQAVPNYDQQRERLPNLSEAEVGARIRI